jgi:hypothetical protein
VFGESTAQKTFDAKKLLISLKTNNRGGRVTETYRLHAVSRSQTGAEDPRDNPNEPNYPRKKLARAGPGFGTERSSLNPEIRIPATQRFRFPPYLDLPEDGCL